MDFKGLQRKAKPAGEALKDPGAKGPDAPPKPAADVPRAPEPGRPPGA